MGISLSHHYLSIELSLCHLSLLCQVMACYCYGEPQHAINLTQTVISDYHWNAGMGYMCVCVCVCVLCVRLCADTFVDLLGLGG